MKLVDEVDKDVPVDNANDKDLSSTDRKNKKVDNEE